MSAPAQFVTAEVSFDLLEPITSAACVLSIAVRAHQLHLYTCLPQLCNQLFSSLVLSVQIPQDKLSANSV